MGSIQNTVYYCCVSKGSRVLYAFSGGDRELEALAALCLERTPSFHTWYFETVGRRTFGFLMEDGYVYFAIVDEGLGNSGALRFLKHLRDEFKQIARNGLKGSFSGLSPICLQEELVPIIRRLISSLENVTRMEAAEGMTDRSTHDPNSSEFNNQMGNLDAATSTKAPLLGKPNKYEKKKMKDRSTETRDTVMEDHGADRGIKFDIAPEPNQNVMSSISLQKSSSSTRIRGQQLARRKWWHYVRIVLAIDVVICLVLFGIWLGICRGFQCIHREDY